MWWGLFSLTYNLLYHADINYSLLMSEKPRNQSHNLCDIYQHITMLKPVDWVLLEILSPHTLLKWILQVYVYICIKVKAVDGTARHIVWLLGTSSVSSSAKLSMSEVMFQTLITKNILDIARFLRWKRKFGCLMSNYLLIWNAARPNIKYKLQLFI